MEVDFQEPTSVRVQAPTEPAPPPSSIVSRDPHPEFYPTEETTSDKVARECGWIAVRGER